MADGRQAEVGQQVDPATVVVLVDGIPLPVAPDLVHYLLYKPVGVISTASDPQGRKAVVSLVPDKPRVFPVGRLDADSEGLLILTNDGALTDLLTHPRFGVTKTYVVMVDGRPSKAAIRRLLDGVVLDDGPARSKAVKIVDSYSGAALLELVMTEGRKREIRRLLDAVGHPVRRLVRTAIGPLRDADLAPGAWRPLSVFEIRELYDAAGGTWEDGATHAPQDPKQ